MPIYVPESATETAYSDILDDVNMRLDNDLEPKTKTFTGDASTKIFHLPHRGIVAGSTSIAGLSEGTGYTVDHQSGYVTFTTAPAAADFDVDYEVRHWSEQLLWRLINNALNSLYPKFYSITSLTPTADANGDYPLVDPHSRVIGGIIDVELVDTSGTIHLRPFYDYRLMRTADEAASLRVFADTSTGTLTVRVGCHPASFSATTTTLLDLELPDRMREPIVLYTCWQAVTQKMPARSRGDNIGAAALEGKTTFFDHVRLVQMFKMLFDTELASNHMRSWALKGL